MDSRDILRKEGEPIYTESRDELGFHRPGICISIFAYFNPRMRRRTLCNPRKVIIIVLQAYFALPHSLSENTLPLGQPRSSMQIRSSPVKALPASFLPRCGPLPAL